MFIHPNLSRSFSSWKLICCYINTTFRHFLQCIAIYWCWRRLSMDQAAQQPQQQRQLFAWRRPNEWEYVAFQKSPVQLKKKLNLHGSLYRRQIARRKAFQSLDREFGVNIWSSFSRLKDCELMLTPLQKGSYHCFHKQYPFNNQTCIYITANLSANSAAVFLCISSSSLLSMLSLQNDFQNTEVQTLIEMCAVHYFRTVISL